MKFYNQIVLTGNLILIKTSKPTMPPCPIMARAYDKKLSLLQWILEMIVNAVSCIADSWAAPIRTDIKHKLAVLYFLAGVVVAMVLESSAQNYLEKVLAAV